LIRLRAVQAAVGVGCTFFFLWLALSRVELRTIAVALTNVRPSWIVVAMLIYGTNLALRAWRWQLILRPVARISYPIVARALVVGYGLNTLLPARLGELFRTEYFKDTYGLSRVWGLTSIVIERLFDGMTVIACLGIGLYLAAAPGEYPDVLIEVLVTASILFGAALIAAFCLSGSTMLGLLGGFPRLSAQMAMVQRGFAVLHTRRTVGIICLTLVIYVPDTLSLWCLVKAAGLTLGFANALVLVGTASLSTLVPSGPAFLGTLQFAYAMAVEFAGGRAATGIAAATLAQLCLFMPIAIVALGIVAHRSGGLIHSLFTKRDADNRLL